MFVYNLVNYDGEKFNGKYWSSCGDYTFHLT